MRSRERCTSSCGGVTAGEAQSTQLGRPGCRAEMASLLGRGGAHHPRHGTTAGTPGRAAVRFRSQRLRSVRVRFPPASTELNPHGLLVVRQREAGNVVKAMRELYPAANSVSPSATIVCFRRAIPTARGGEPSPKKQPANALPKPLRDGLRRRKAFAIELNPVQNPTILGNDCLSRQRSGLCGQDADASTGASNTARVQRSAGAGAGCRVSPTKRYQLFVAP